MQNPQVFDPCTIITVFHSVVSSTTMIIRLHAPKQNSPKDLGHSWFGINLSTFNPTELFAYVLHTIWLFSEFDSDFGVGKQFLDIP